MHKRDLTDEEIEKAGLTQFEKLAKETQKRSEQEQHDICLLIYGYLAHSASEKIEKVN